MSASETNFEFESRQELERLIALDVVRPVALTNGKWRGSTSLLVHKMTVAEWQKHEHVIEKLASLITVSTAKKVLTKLTEIDDQVSLHGLFTFYMKELIEPAMPLILACCRVEPDQESDLRHVCYMEDFLNVFWEIVDLHLFDPRVRALQKKIDEGIRHRRDLEELYQNSSEDIQGTA